MDIFSLSKKILQGNRQALAKAITLAESTRHEHRTVAESLLTKLLTHSGNSIRVGVTGAPGVGKSSFIESLGLYLVGLGKRVAVLAVDPTSRVSGGSILGDKTRMENLSRNHAAFIRPSPSGDNLGGVARRTRECIFICEAAGFDVVIIETVGVGQSETAVAEMSDLFLLLLAPAAGDELQGIKKGIVELADLIVVNKSDGELLASASQAAADYRTAVGMLRPTSFKWQIPVLTCSALLGDGISDVWSTIKKFQTIMLDSGEFKNRRAEQSKSSMWAEIEESLIANLRSHPEVEAKAKVLEGKVADGILAPRTAARELLTMFLKYSMLEEP